MLAYQVWLLSRMDPLKSLFEKPALSGRTARWQLLLSEFDITYVTQKSIKARAPPAYLKLRPLSSNQCLPWPVLPCSYLHRKRTALFNPAFCHSLTSFPLLFVLRLLLGQKSQLFSSFVWCFPISSFFSWTIFESRIPARSASYNRFTDIGK